MAIRANNLGQILKAQGDLPGALEQTRRALEIWTQFLGSEHPNTKIAAGNLAWIKAEIQKQKGDKE